MLAFASGKLKVEAGLIVRDSLRAARHAVFVGRRLVVTADPARLEGSELFKGVDRIAESAAGAASRLAHAAFDLIEPTTPRVLPCPAEALLEAGQESSIGVAHAGYKALRQACKLLGTEDALVMETRIESAFLAAKREASDTGMGALAFSAALTWQLLHRNAIVHVASRESSSPARTGAVNPVATTASVALGLAIAAASCQGLDEAEADALLASACTMVLALADEVAAVAGPKHLQDLFETYAPHV